MFGSQKVLPTTPWLSGYRPVTSVKWFGNVRDGKEGSMCLGETPLRMNEFRVGVSPRLRKSARKPSSEIKIVVGANVCVPLESVLAIDGGASDIGLALLDCEALYAPYTRLRKARVMTMYSAANLPMRFALDYNNVSIDCKYSGRSYRCPPSSASPVSRPRPSYQSH